MTLKIYDTIVNYAHEEHGNVNWKKNHKNRIPVQSASSLDIWNFTEILVFVFLDGGSVLMSLNQISQKYIWIVGFFSNNLERIISQSSWEWSHGELSHEELRSERNRSSQWKKVQIEYKIWKKKCAECCAELSWAVEQVVELLLWKKEKYLWKSGKWRRRWNGD